MVPLVHSIPASQEDSTQRKDRIGVALAYRIRGTGIHPDMRTERITHLVMESVAISEMINFDGYTEGSPGRCWRGMTGVTHSHLITIACP